MLLLETLKNLLWFYERMIYLMAACAFGALFLVPKYRHSTTRAGLVAVMWIGLLWPMYLWGIAEQRWRGNDERRRQATVRDDDKAGEEGASDTAREAAKTAGGSFVIYVAGQPAGDVEGGVPHADETGRCVHCGR